MAPGDEAVYQADGYLVLADVCVATATEAAEKVVTEHWAGCKFAGPLVGRGK